MELAILSGYVKEGDMYRSDAVALEMSEYSFSGMSHDGARNESGGRSFD